MKKYEYICMDEECMKEGGPCTLSCWSDQTPDYPNWCPFEFKPSELKYKPWKRVNE